MLLPLLLLNPLRTSIPQILSTCGYLILVVPLAALLGLGGVGASGHDLTAQEQLL